MPIFNLQHRWALAGGINNSVSSHFNTEVLFFFQKDFKLSNELVLTSSQQHSAFQFPTSYKCNSEGIIISELCIVGRTTQMSVWSKYALFLHSRF